MIFGHKFSEQFGKYQNDARGACPKIVKRPLLKSHFKKSQLSSFGVQKRCCAKISVRRINLASAFNCRHCIPCPALPEK